MFSHAEGTNTLAYGFTSHAEGENDRYRANNFLTLTGEAGALTYTYEI
jgi:hypothetical protein